MAAGESSWTPGAANFRIHVLVVMDLIESVGKGGANAEADLELTKTSDTQLATWFNRRGRIIIVCMIALGQPSTWIPRKLSAKALCVCCSDFISRCCVLFSLLLRDNVADSRCFSRASQDRYVLKPMKKRVICVKHKIVVVLIISFSMASKILLMKREWRSSICT